MDHRVPVTRHTYVDYVVIPKDLMHGGHRTVLRAIILGPCRMLNRLPPGRRPHGLATSD